MAWDDVLRGLQTMPSNGKPMAERIARALALQRKFAADPESLTPEEDRELLEIMLGQSAAESGRCTCKAGTGPHRDWCPLYPYRQVGS